MRAQSACVTLLRPLALFVAATVAPSLTYAASEAEAKALLDSKCMSCHLPVEGKGLSRIDESRRTPEGWDMTIQRMVVAHGVQIAADERKTLVKYLADTHGLAPEEVQDRRYLLERDFTLIETPDDQLVHDTCGRCHSYGRIALQRRTEDDWRKLAHFHVGQYPVIEIQASGRDREWWKIASEQVPPLLGKLYPVNSESWSKWQAHKAASAAGSWRIVGHRPGWGAYEGTATVKANGEADHYTIDMQLNYADGRKETAKGDAVVYTGYEWRASVQQGNEKVRQVFTLSPDGQTLSGRWHQDGVDSLGGRFEAVRNGEGSTPRLLAVEPSYIRAGTVQRISLYGSNLSGDVDLGPDLEVLKVVERSSDKVVVDVRAASDASDGVRPASVGKTRLDQGLAYYQKLDFLEVEPGYAMANIGGNGGSRPKIPVQFESVGYAFGPDGKQGTEDDIRLGVFPATWSVDNLSEYAAQQRDIEFAGTLQPDGLFIPGDAGPNPKRKFGTNNAGELKVTAVVDDAGRRVEASKPLVVTVQRWNDPHIR
ncbi:quinohemoprotein amine dehydrogenase subunit alpha [Stutzerimonas stutzeri]|uniref:quinohemoprotein amine dehydrogenase subunit alpha n=1 Tax=Stutzerimonas stutzeri TaxID=316 RepID=UPI002659F13A|nr:quinohemoprotein amine dehydrogenase subunit alpha [Stutzerimonas stutzeri]MCF6783449.1 quinohemoprotein amine dehydrogenase subunit alpha [Stutzerimonas stutzeri]MCF6806379.1 quinohemoprotein amine dehydrogenase subunit alpha [Stutzerimonas stutzeri]